MKKIILVFLPLILFLNYACKQESKQSGINNNFQSASSGEHYIITSLGDSIPSGVPLSGSGRVVEAENISLPKSLPIKQPLKKIPIQSNTNPLGQPQKLPPPENPRIIVIGQNDVPFAETVPAIGEPIPAIQPAPIKSGKPYMKDEAVANLQIWNLDQGLNAPYITDLLQDRRGHIWIITKEGGVSRFDGNYFTHYTIKEGLPFNDPLCMMEDNNGNIWIGGFQGLIRYDGNQFTHFTQKDGLEDVAIYSMMEDKKGSLWFAGHGHLTRFDPDEDIFTHFNPDHGFLINLPIRAMKEDRHGNIWCGSVWGGFYLFDPSEDGKGGRISHYAMEQGFGNMFFSSILENEDGSIWLGTSNGLYNVKTNSSGQIDELNLYQTDQGLTSGRIFSLVKDPQGDIWLGTRNGINRMHIDQEDGVKSHGTVTYYSEEQGLSNNRVNSLLQDDHGNLWIGTRDGLNRLMDGRFTYLPHEALSDYPIHTILDDQEGNLWFGSSNTPTPLFKIEGNIIDGHLEKELGLFEDYGALSLFNVQAIRDDQTGNIWMGLYDEGGMRSFLPGDQTNGGLFQLYNVSEGLLTQYVHDLYVDSKGNIWAGGVGGLTCHVPAQNTGEKGRFIHFNRENGFPSFVVLSILEDSNKHLWFGTQRGVSRYQPNEDPASGSFTHFTNQEGLCDSWITSIMEDSNGNLWFGSYGGGVSLLKTADESSIRFHQFDVENGLSHNIIQSIMEDDENNIWISTQKGLNRLSPREKSDSNENISSVHGYQITNFEQKDGLKNVDFAKGVCMDNNRHIWWGTNQGVSLLDLNRFAFSSTPPKLEMSTVEIGQTHIDYRRLSDSIYRERVNAGYTISQAFDSVATFYNYPVNLVLPYNLNHLTFSFTSTEWSAPHKIEYSYWMDGVDKDWSLPVSESSVEYRGLSHGRHTLKVRAKSEAQIWSEPLEYSFRIMPPWWQSTLAYVIYGLLSLAAIWGIFQWRTAALRKRKRELEQTVKERTAEVVSQRDVIAREKDRSEALLLNILPADIAEELKVNGESPARDFETVTVLFTDFKGFTNISEKLSAKELVAELNACFKAFDEIVTKHKIEKIKTIGDAYMAAGGIHFPRQTEPKDVVMAALEMQQFILDRQQKRKDQNQPFFEMRCGIHTGPVVAGIVGVRKFQYDIWGDTVNLAARMESSGEVGKVNISQDTYECLKDNPDFSFVSRGKVKAKNKGEIEMYYVNYSSLLAES